MGKYLVAIIGVLFFVHFTENVTDTLILLLLNECTFSLPYISLDTKYLIGKSVRRTT